MDHKLTVVYCWCWPEAESEGPAPAPASPPAELGAVVVCAPAHAPPAEVSAYVVQVVLGKGGDPAFQDGVLGWCGETRRWVPLATSAVRHWYTPVLWVGPRPPPATLLPAMCHAISVAERTEAVRTLEASVAAGAWSAEALQAPEDAAATALSVRPSRRVAFAEAVPRVQTYRPADPAAAAGGATPLSAASRDAYVCAAAVGDSRVVVCVRRKQVFAALLAKKAQLLPPVVACNPHKQELWLEVPPGSALLREVAAPTALQLTALWQFMTHVAAMPAVHWARPDGSCLLWCEGLGKWAFLLPAGLTPAQGRRRATTTTKAQRLAALACAPWANVPPSVAEWLVRVAAPAAAGGPASP